jgi:hypothetical protein
MGYAKTTSLFLLLFCLLGVPSSAMAGFGIENFAVSARNADGTIDELAASHPFLLDVHLSMDTNVSGEPEGSVKTIKLDLPPGMVGNALAVPRCSPAEFQSTPPQCGGSTQVGILHGAITGMGHVNLPVFNLVSVPGHAATFGVMVNGEPILEQLNLAGTGAASSIRLSITLPAAPTIVDIQEEIWGVPADRAHDPERTCRGAADQQAGACLLGPEEPLLTLPASCGEPMRTTLAATSYDLPPVTAVATALSRDGGGNPRPLVGCEDIPFEPKFTATTDAAALSPTPLEIGIEVPQHESLGVTPAAPLAGLEIALPAGLTLNPSAGSWLAGCSPAAIAESPAGCPASSRLGSIVLHTPLIDHSLQGSVYLATPGANPFGTRYAIYLAIEDEAGGIAMKIPARLEADPADGRLIAVAPELPPVPIADLDLEFAGGPRAPLASPPSCGKYSTDAVFTPTTAPFAPPATRTSTFSTSTGPWGGACPPPEAERNAAPSLQAGTESPRAGGDSSLTIHLSREDADQHFGSFDLTLPPGLVANLGSAPIGTTVGDVRVRAGIGPEPSTLGGTVRLGGPYRGAPYSLEISVPAKVGPFDLGTIVQRAAIEVDPLTAQISVHSDPLPRILAGVPLELRSLSVDLDRPGFVRNPTSCEPMAIAGSATTSLGQTVPLSTRFQVGDCAALAFKPQLSLRLTGRLGRNGHPGLHAVYKGDPGGAAPAGLSFDLPPGELLDLGHVRALCPRQLAADRCPAGSLLGSLRLESPFLAGSAAGPIYLREPARGLPDLIAEVRSGGLRFVLHGRTFVRKGRLAVGFGSLPDIPLSRAVLDVPGGRSGILVNSRALCPRAGVVTGTATAHNGMKHRLRLRPQVGRC